MVLDGLEGLECKVCRNGILLEQVSQFKYLGCVLDKSGEDGEECCRKVVSRRVVGAIRSLVNARVLHESLFIAVLMYGSEIMKWKEEL